MNSVLKFKVKDFQDFLGGKKSPLLNKFFNQYSYSFLFKLSEGVKSKKYPIRNLTTLKMPYDNMYIDKNGYVYVEEDRDIALVFVPTDKNEIVIPDFLDGKAVTKLNYDIFRYSDAKNITGGSNLTKVQRVPKNLPCLKDDYGTGKDIRGDDCVVLFKYLDTGKRKILTNISGNSLFCDEIHIDNQKFDSVVENNLSLISSKDYYIETKNFCISGQPLINSDFATIHLPKDAKRYKQRTQLSDCELNELWKDAENDKRNYICIKNELSLLLNEMKKEIRESERE